MKSAKYFHALNIGIAPNGSIESSLYATVLPDFSS